MTYTDRTAAPKSGAPHMHGLSAMDKAITDILLRLTKLEKQAPASDTSAMADLTSRVEFLEVLTCPPKP